MHKFFLIIIFVFSIINSFSENVDLRTTIANKEKSEKDSLFVIINPNNKNIFSTEEKIKAYLSLSKMYMSSNLDTALIYANQALKISRKIKSDKYLAESLASLGTIYYYTSQYYLSINKNKEAANLFEKIKNYDRLSDVYNNIGLVYTTIENNTYALQYLKKTYKIKKQINDKYNEALSLLNIGVIYINTKQYDSAGFYINKAVPTFEYLLKTEDSVKAFRGMAYAYNNLGIIYQYSEDYNKTLDYYKKSLKYLFVTNDNNNIANAYLNIASVYLDLSENAKATNKKESFDYAKEARAYLLKAIELSKKLSDENMLFQAYAAMSEYYALVDSFKQAYNYQNLYITIKDSLFNIKKLKAIEDVEAKYQSLKKQSELEKNKLEIKNKKNIIRKQKQLIDIAVFTLSVIVVLIILLIVYLRKNRQITKSINKRNKEFEYINKELKKSLDISRVIQKAFIVGFKNKDLFFSEYFIIDKSKEIVGGDFIWSRTIADTIFISMADCVGHGVPGAMVSMIMGNILEENTLYSTQKTGEILNQTRASLVKKVEQMKYTYSFVGADMSLIKFSRNDFILEYSGANLPIYIISENNINLPALSYKRFEIVGIKGVLYEIIPDRMPIGKYEISDDFNTIKTKLNEGDIIYMFTDGYADQFGGERNKKFKYRYFKNMLLEIYDKPLYIQKEIINDRFKAWIGDNEQIDDITILALKV